MTDSRKILISAPFLIALGVLLLNDHVLKTAYPGWLTGKLSDFAGLYVMAVFCYAILGRYFRSNRSLLVLHTGIGIAFAAWKVAPVELIFIEISKLISIPLPSRVKDISDLIALMILPLSYYHIHRFRELPNVSLSLPKLKRVLSSGVLLLAGLAIIATYSGKRYEIRPNVEQKTYMAWPEIRETFENVLAENNVTILNSHAVDDTTYIYKLDFKAAKRVDAHEAKQVEIWYVSFLTLVYSPSTNMVGIKDINGWVAKDMPDEKAINKTYVNKIIEPFFKNMKY